MKAEALTAIFVRHGCGYKGDHEWPIRYQMSWRHRQVRRAHLKQVQNWDRWDTRGICWQSDRLGLALALLGSLPFHSLIMPTKVRQVKEEGG